MLEVQILPLQFLFPTKTHMSQPTEPVTVIEPERGLEIPWGFTNPKAEAKAAKALGIDNPNTAKAEKPAQ